MSCVDYISGNLYECINIHQYTLNASDFIFFALSATPSGACAAVSIYNQVTFLESSVK